MKLPVTNEVVRPSPITLWRRFADVAFDHALALGEELSLAGARGVVLPGEIVETANKVFIAEDGPAIDVQAVHEAFASHGRPTWIVPDHATKVATALHGAGYVRRPYAAMRASAVGTSPNVDKSSTMLLPGRAARAAYTTWCDGRRAAEPLAARLPEHSDDPHYESVVALTAGHVVGGIGLQTRGQIGLICDLYVQPADRRSGIGSRLVARAIENAARGQLLDLFAGVSDEDIETMRLLNRNGFSTVCGYASLVRPSTAS